MRRTGFTPTVLYLGQWPLQVEEPTDLTKSEQLPLKLPDWVRLALYRHKLSTQR